MNKQYKLKGNFEKYLKGETLDEIDVDRYLKCYPYMIEVIGDTGEATAPAIDDIATAKENIEKKRKPRRNAAAKTKAEKPAEAIEQSTAKPGDE